MKCTYTINDKIFNSELELEEYLILTQPFLEEMGDIVFDRSSEQNLALQRLGEINKKVVDTTKNKVKVRTVEDIENALTEGTDGELLDLDELVSLDTNSYITISDLIRSMSTVEGTLLTPVFRSEEYWIRAKRAFTNIDNFQEGSDYYSLVPFIFDQKPDGSYDIHEITDPDEFNRARLRVEYIWKTQSLIGTAVHNALSAYYRNCADHSPKKFTSDRNKLKERILEKLTESDKKFIEEHIENILDTCENFNKQLMTQFGEDCIVLPEYSVQGEGNFEGKKATVIGRLDLIVIKKDGSMAVVDFKCSPKNYSQYNDIKVRTFDYQLAAYRRMLIEAGLVSIKHKEKCSLYAVPIKFEGFRYDKDSHECLFDKISIEEVAFKELNVSQKVSGGTEYDTVETNLDQVFVPIQEDLLDNNTILSNVTEEMKVLFPLLPNEIVDDSSVAEYIQSHGGIIKNSEGFEFHWKKNPRKLSDIIQAKTEKDLIAKIKGILVSRQLRTGENTESIIRALKEAWEKGDKRLFSYNAKSYKGVGNKEYTQDRLQKYADDRWELLEMPSPGYQDILSSMGIILFHNKLTDQVDVVKISSHIIDSKVNVKGSRNTIFGTFLDDTRAMNNNTQIKPLENFSGNVDLIQVMSVLNQLAPLFNNKIIGNIQVINPDLQQGMQATNKQLLYNYSTLLRLSKRQNNFLYAGKGIIKMASFVDLAKQKLNEIIFSENELTFNENSRFKKFKGYIPKFDEYCNDFEKLYVQLDLLRQEMEKEYGTLLDTVNFTLTEKNENEDPKYTLYRYILMAMGELKGITYSQQIEEHESIMDGSFREAVLNGWNGTRIDNPGSLKNDNLNKLAELTMQQYDKVRQDLIRVNYKVRELTQKLKEEKQFGRIARYTFGNQTSMYQNMYDETMKKQNELYFKNPWDNNTELSNVEREYLKYAITLINMQRFKNVTEDNIEELVETNPDDYLRVPLTRGDLEAKTANNGGFLNMIKNRFKKLDLQHIFSKEWNENMKDKIKQQLQNIYADTEENKIQQNQQWEMVSSFEFGENPEYRAKKIKENGIDYYETNLEKLLLKHTQASSAKEHLDSVFPLFKSIMLHISNQGIVKNEQFVKDLQYAQDFIKSKIFNYPLDDVEKWGLAQLSAAKLMQAASRVALWMNPRQLYQGLDGIWKDISLFIKNPDGKESFTKKNLTEAAFWVYQDIRHFGDSFTMAELLNMTYGLNDMDANTVADRMHQDTAGFFNLESLGFRFSSRPDYYNRLTIFGAQMKGDGCFDAHSMVDGKLVYDWKKDKRFDKFANWTEEQYKNASAEDKAEYNKQKALYVAMAKEFVETGFKNPDGSYFEFDVNKKNPLPRAYTNRQAESMKELADKIYGYYSHEKRSLIQSNTIGAMFFQMFTYASSKKNQYFSGRLYNQEGEYEHYYDTYIDDEGKEQKNYWYEVLNDDGTTTIVDQNHLPEDSSKYIPLMQWKGRPSEGAWVTLVRLSKIAFQGDPETGEKGYWAAVHAFKNAKDAEKVLYRNNLGQLLYDILALILIGTFFAPAMVSLSEKASKDLGDEELGPAFIGSAMTLGSEWLTASAEDFNLIKSLGGRGLTWTPFSLQTLQRVSKNVVSVLSGSKDTYDAAVNTFGATRATKPVWNVVKLDLLGREIGDNGNT